MNRRRRASMLEEGAWGRNLLKVSLPLVRSNHGITCNHHVPVTSKTDDCSVKAANPASSPKQRQGIARKTAAEVCQAGKGTVLRVPGTVRSPNPPRNLAAARKSYSNIPGSVSTDPLSSALETPNGNPALASRRTDWRWVERSRQTYTFPSQSPVSSCELLSRSVGGLSIFVKSRATGTRKF